MNGKITCRYFKILDVRATHNPINKINLIIDLVCHSTDPENSLTRGGLVERMLNVNR